MLKTGLLLLEASRPGMLEKLSREKSRVRRIVARDPKNLFENPKLFKDQHFEELAPGWWLGTNNSLQQVKVWLRRACECANLIWAEDFKIGGFR